jgi:hypothetical protein
MLLAWTLTCLVALGASTVLLISFGHWLRFSFRLAGLIVIAAVVGARRAGCRQRLAATLAVRPSG